MAKIDYGETWALHAAINIKYALPLLQEQCPEKMNVRKMAKRIKLKFENPAHWNNKVNERCDPEIKTYLMLK